jgi:hypothetical protein
VGVAFAGLGLRMIIYFCVMAAVTATLGLWPGIGSAVGCMTVSAALLFRHIALPKLRKARGLPPDSSDPASRRYFYEAHIRGDDGALRYVFIPGSSMERASGGRIYMTHRRFRKLVAIRSAHAGKGGDL